MNKRTCSIENCGKPMHARDWCSRHYSAWRNHGDPLSGNGRKYTDPEEAFAARTAWQGDCLIWTGSITNLGYGMMTERGRRVMAHRYAWERSNGRIPLGMEVDHTCWNRACCNVDHLRIATHAENGRNRNGASSRSKSGIRNVSVEGDRHKVYVGDKYLGVFPDLETAVSVASREREVRFGDFAGRG